MHSNDKNNTIEIPLIPSPTPTHPFRIAKETKW